MIVIDVVAALVNQVWLILTSGPDRNTAETVALVGVATRMIQTLSFFTIQSNILLLIVAAGPRPRIDRTTMAWAFLWPIAWIAYTFIRGGPLVPLPIPDVDEVGYWAAIGSTLFVLALALVLVAIFKRIDGIRTIGGTPMQLQVPTTSRSPASQGES